MTKIIHINDGQTGYGEICRTVRRDGDLRRPRDIETWDLGHTIIVLDSPFNAMPLGTGRDLNAKIGYAEAIQLIGGFSDPNFMLNIAPQFANYMEDEGFFHGAYGRRIGTQLRDVVHKLQADKNTRQAVLTLWDPQLDNWAGKRDYPCTVAIGFALRRRRLDMNVTMRSNDAWLGLPYDLFQFSQLMLTVAHALEVDPGTYTHTAWSLHLYSRDALKVDKLFDPSEEAKLQIQPDGWGKDGEDISRIITRAHRLHYHGLSLPDELTLAEEDYRDTLYR